VNTGVNLALDAAGIGYLDALMSFRPLLTPSLSRSTAVLAKEWSQGVDFASSFMGTSFIKPLLAGTSDNFGIPRTMLPFEQDHPLVYAIATATLPTGLAVNGAKSLVSCASAVAVR
jgi:hypothetical protein